MKKIKHIIGTFLGLSSVGIITPIAESCSTTTNANSSIDYDSKIDEAKKDLITKQSAIDLNNLFNENVNLRNNEQKLLTKEEIAKKVVLNKDNFIYQKLNENNLITKFEEETTDVIYQSYLDEIQTNEINNTIRCGSIFRSHFWNAVGHKIWGGSLFVLSTLWWGIQLAPAIYNFVQSGDASGFIGIEFDLPSFVMPLVNKTINGIKKFKKDTNCKWKFVVWKGTLNQPTVEI